MEPPAQAPTPNDAALIEQALIVYDRYVKEVVEGFNFCPFARTSRESGGVDVRVLTDREIAADALLSVLDQVAAREATEIGILIFPRDLRGLRDWQRLVADMHQADANNPRKYAKVWAQAAFHPDAQADLTSPSRLVSFIRRTPDPTIQLVRLSTLAQVRAKDPKETTFVEPARIDQFVKDLMANPERVPKVSTHDRIAQANLETVQRESVAKIEAILQSIKAERDERYRAIGEVLHR